MSNMRFLTQGCGFTGTLIAGFILLIGLTAGRAAAAGQRAPGGSPAAGPKEPALRKELLARQQKDQEARKRLVNWAKENNLAFGSKEFLERGRPLIRQVRKIDAENRKWLSEVVDQHGWPGRTLVGADGAGAAFLLVQHADGDRPLQKRCLKLMQQAPKGEVQPANIAYLTDRVRLAEGKKQLYGTQVELKDGRWQVRGVEDPDQLDERRRQMGLPPIAIYLETIERLYGSPKEDVEQSSDDK